MIQRAYKTELDPTAAQRRALAQHVSAARVAHNWVLEMWHVHDATRAIARGVRALADLDTKGGEAACMLGYTLAAMLRGEPQKVRTPKGEPQRYRYRPAPGVAIPDFAASSIDWYSRLAFTRDEQPERFGWLTEVSSFAVREAVLDVSDGWKHFFEHLKAGRYGRAGEPRFRRRTKATYHADQPQPIRTTDRAVKIPSVGWVRLKERGYLPVTHENSHQFVGGGKTIGLGLSERDGRWYVALRCEVPALQPQKRGPGRALRDRPVPRVAGRRIGVENGVRVLAVAYDGDSSDTVVDAGLRDDERILRLISSRKLWERRMARRWRNGVPSRDQSAGWHEARQRVAHYHARIVDLRDDRTGKAVRRIVDRGAEVVLMREPHTHELLNRKTAPDAQVRNRLAPDVHGARMGDLRERLEYKQRWAGGRVELVDKFEPVTKRCSNCGAVRATSPSYPNFKCACGHVEDRDDANAPKNLYNYSGGSSSGAAGPRSAGSKPSSDSSDENNGREKRTVRAEEQSEVTTPHRSGNRARPGAPRSTRSIGSDHDISLERLGTAQHSSVQDHADTAVHEPKIGDLSQTAPQVRDSSTPLSGRSGGIS